MVELGVVGMTVFLCMVGSVVRPVKNMKGLERTFWLVLLLTLAVVLLPRNWEYRKPMWFIFGLLCAWSATVHRRDREHGRRDQKAVAS
jgi:succinate dehydrogenase hydrophobic anchor subunit